MNRALMLPALALMAACAPKTLPSSEPGGFPAEPELGKPSLWTPPVPREATTPQGVDIAVVDKHDLPLISLRFVSKQGTIWDDASEAGLTTLGASMLTEGAAGRTSLEQAAAFADLGIQVSSWAARDGWVYEMEMHSDDLEAGMALMADALLRPNFSQDDWNRVYENHVIGVQSSLDDNGTVAANVGMQQLYGVGHPYGLPRDGTLSSLQNIDLDDVKRWYDTAVVDPMIIAVGDTSTDELATLTEKYLGDLPIAAVKRAPVPAPAPQAGLYLVDQPGASQTAIDIFHLGTGVDDPARPPLNLATVVMGGSFTSRLNNRLREQLGLTYGARMSASAESHVPGRTIAYAKIRTDATGQGLTEFHELMRAGRDDGFSQADLELARAQVLARTVASGESRSSLADLYASLELAGTDVDAFSKRLKAIETATPGDMQAAMKAYADIDEAVIVLVGDLEKITPQLSEAGFTEWTVLNREGSRVD